MKSLIVVLCLLISYQSYGQSHYMRLADFEACKNGEPVSLYSPKSLCQGECIEWPNNVSCDVAKLTDVYIADITKPIYSETGHVTCLKEELPVVEGEESSYLPLCTLIDFSCGQGEVVVSEDETTVTSHCKILEGYEQKFSHKIIEVDPALKDAKDLAESQKQVLETALAQAEKAIDCGKHAQKILLLRNAPKQLSTEQIKQMVGTYSDIKQLLDTGSLVSAKEEIMAVTADGVLITNDDKTALINAIDACMGN